MGPGCCAALGVCLGLGPMDAASVGGPVPFQPTPGPARTLSACFETCA